MLLTGRCLRVETGLIIIIGKFYRPITVSLSVEIYTIGPVDLSLRGFPDHEQFE